MVEDTLSFVFRIEIFMTHKLTKWKISKFPEGARLPPFTFSNAIGPDFIDSILKSLYNDKVTIETLDLDSGLVDVLNGFNELVAGGDHIYVAYDQECTWVYVVSTDLDWGILYSNKELGLVYPLLDLREAKRNFDLSLLRRMTSERVYFDPEKLAAWASAAVI